MKSASGFFFSLRLLSATETVVGGFAKRTDGMLTYRKLSGHVHNSREIYTSCALM
jgi:hypothetical protein